MKESRFFGIYENKRKLFTKNFVPGQKVYDEYIFKKGKDEYREWNPFKSKLAAAIMMGIDQIGVRPGKVVLYLGASTGTTVSHVSDMVGKDGFVFAVDFAPRVVRELVFMCEKRKNVAPILESANNIEELQKRIVKVDYIFQDIAQRDQIDIFLKNVDAFLKKGGFGFLCLKARSIDVSRNPKKIFKEAKTIISQKLNLIAHTELGNYERDHAVFLIKK